jgi:hypothetical protein
MDDAHLRSDRRGERMFQSLSLAEREELERRRFEDDRHREQRSKTFRMIVWSIALIAILGVTGNGWYQLSQAAGAPQQAASAGMSCFYIIAVYATARALDRISRP